MFYSSKSSASSKSKELLSVPGVRNNTLIPVMILYLSELLNGAGADIENVEYH